MKGLLTIILIFLLTPITDAITYKELFEREFLGKPWIVERAEESTCIECHTSDTMSPQLRDIPDEWKKSWHYQNNVSCHNCHGGDHKDKSMAMSHTRGFVGKPTYTDVPDFCGKCHIGILENYRQSGHGKALASTGKGPNCVTCHGSHNIQRASVDIIYERRCTQCHSYERAKTIKQALFGIEDKMQGLGKDIAFLRSQGIYMDEDEKALFRTQAEFRRLFHTVDVNLIKANTDEFLRRLKIIDEKVKDSFKEIGFRRNFSVLLMLLFLGLGIVISLISKRQ